NYCYIHTFLYLSFKNAKARFRCISPGPAQEDTRLTVMLIERFLHLSSSLIERDPRRSFSLSILLANCVQPVSSSSRAHTTSPRSLTVTHTRRGPGRDRRRDRRD